MTTLCIIDMQTVFSSTAKHCLAAVCHQIKLAKRREAGIVLIEYNNCGETYQEIKILLASYKHTAYATKHGIGGGEEFLAAAKKAKINTDKVRFVGVMREHCVLQTIKEVIDLVNCRIEIVTKATWSNAPTRGLNQLRRLGKII